MPVYLKSREGRAPFNRKRILASHVKFRFRFKQNDATVLLLLLLRLCPTTLLPPLLLPPLLLPPLLLLIYFLSALPDLINFKDYLGSSIIRAAN